MKNVAIKLLKVMEEVGAKVSKSGFNKHQNYAYIMESDLLDVVRVGCIKHGLAIFTSVESHSKEGDIVTVNLEHTLVDTESGESFIVKSSGTGADRSDKALPKAVTMSNKYFLLKLFQLSGDDDAENDGVTSLNKDPKTKPLSKPETKPETKAIEPPKTTPVTVKLPPSGNVPKPISFSTKPKSDAPKTNFDFGSKKLDPTTIPDLNDVLDADPQF